MVVGGFNTHYRKKERKKMVQDHRRAAEEIVQELLVEDPAFLREIVERGPTDLGGADDRARGGRRYL